jgi:hypothetical protein
LAGDPATAATRRVDCNPDKRHRDSHTRRDADAGVAVPRQGLDIEPVETAAEG